MKPETKAELISIGTVDVDSPLLEKITTPTAGPGAGKTALFFKSGGKRVRLTVDEKSPLKAIIDDSKMVIYKNGEEFVSGKFEKELIHCPEQAYITISEKCVYDCKFCPVPKLNGRVKTFDEVLQYIHEAYSTGKMKAISITSGVADTPEKEVDRSVEIVRAIKKYNVPIGVSVYPTTNSTKRLKDAGADEIKYNVETMDRDIYKEVCSGQDLDIILKHLHEAVEIFGRNNVYSNFIIGLGESYETVEKGIEELASMGVIPILRAGVMPSQRVGEIEIERPSAKQLLKLTRVLRRTLDRYGLRADKSRTMCLPCTGCDLNPHKDLD
ncbi:MAG: radical SAM protein [Methanohalobium sp.]|uniref:radical SAM protein n=1 Tax=Methanohalobium sp. TaxID=2837493 RepID=UPI00397D231A